MSYEQKYLKYKQKYLDLKQEYELLTETNNIQNQNGGNISKTEQYLLTETPSFNNILHNTTQNQYQSGGNMNNIEQTEQHIVLSDTPTFSHQTQTQTQTQIGGNMMGQPIESFEIDLDDLYKQQGGMAPFKFSGSTCTGHVNSPTTRVPTQTTTLASATQTTHVPTTLAPTTQTTLAPTTLAPTQLGGSENINEITNTEDIEQLFQQLGGNLNDLNTETTGVLGTSSVSDSSELNISLSISDL